MAATLPQKTPPSDGRTATLVVAGFATVLVAISVGIAAYSLGGVATLSSVSTFEESLPLVTNAGCLVIVFALFGGLTWHLHRATWRLRAENVELSRLAIVATKMDHAAFITNPDGNIQWVNDGFVRLTGHAAKESLGKQPAPLLLGPLQNINVTQKIRDGIAHRRSFTLEFLCSNRQGHRFWLSLNLTPVVEDDGIVRHFVGVGSDITSRRKAEDEVAKVGKRSELLLDAAADGILGFDLQGAISFANASAARMTGFDRDHLIGQPLSTILGQLRVDPDNSVQDELFAGAAFIDGCVRVGDSDEFLRKDGTSFPVEYSSTPVYEGDDRIGSVVVFRDVTASAQAAALQTRQMRQAALRADVAFALASGDALQSFLGRAMLCLVKHLDGAFARIWTFNPADNMLELQASAGIYSHINGAHSRIPVGTLKVGKIALEQSPEISENLLADPDILDKDWVARERMVAFIGLPLFLEGQLVGVMAMFSRQRLPDDAMELFGAVSDSIAQGIVRKRAEESGIRQAAILDQANDAVIVVGLDDRILSWNAAADRLYGWNGAPQTGRFGNELLTPDKAAYEHAKAVALQQGLWRDAFATIQRDDGAVVPVDSRWSVAIDDAGEPQSIVIVQVDTSTRHQLERQLLACQRGEMVGLLARGLAHQLTDTFSPILVSSQTLRNRVGDAAVAETLGLLECKARRGLELVQQVLALGQTSADPPRRVAPGTLLENVAGIVHGTFPKNAQIRSRAQDLLWFIHADAVLLQQALLNVAFVVGVQIADGGTLTFSALNVYLQEGSPDLPDSAETGCYACFMIEHTGRGLSDETLALPTAPPAVEVDLPTPEPATGAPTSLEVDRALRCAVRIVREHHGFVRAGGAIPGSSLSIFLPAEEPAGGYLPGPESPPVPVGNGELILVVDDEEPLLAITKEALESFGYRTLTAHDGVEAVAVYSAHRSEIRVVITDMLMPNMDGPSTIRVLRKLDPAVPIIASSGMLEPARVRELTGMDDLAFLEKPYTANALRQCVHEQLAC